MTVISIRSESDYIKPDTWYILVMVCQNDVLPKTAGSMLMRRSQAKKTNPGRFGMRLSADLKQTIEQAAKLKGLPTAGYVKSVLAAAAAKDIQEYEFLQLSFRDREEFVRAILSPPKPSQRAIDAAKQYKKTLGL